MYVLPLQEVNPNHKIILLNEINETVFECNIRQGQDLKQYQNRLDLFAENYPTVIAHVYRLTQKLSNNDVSVSEELKTILSIVDNAKIVWFSKRIVGPEWARTVHVRIRYRIRWSWKEVIIYASPIFYTKEDVDEYTDILTQAGIIRNGHGGDSSDYKPKNVFSYVTPEPFCCSNLLELDTTIKSSHLFLNLGNSSVIRKNVANNLLITEQLYRIKKIKNNCSVDELNGFKTYALELLNPRVSLTDSYIKFCESSISRKNQIKKNYGEVHAAMCMAEQYDVYDIMIPTASNFPVSDFFLRKTNSVGNLEDAIGVSVKMAESCAVTSITQVLRLLYSKENADQLGLMYKSLSHMISKPGLRKKYDNYDLNDVREQCIMLLSEHSSTVFSNMDEVYYSFSSRKDIVSNVPDEIFRWTTLQMLSVLVKHKNVATEIYNQRILPYLDHDKISKRMLSAKTFENGTVTYVPMDFRRVSVCGPKTRAEFSPCVMNLTVNF